MGSTLPFLLMYESHDMRHIGFRKLTMVNGTLGIEASQNPKLKVKIFN